MTERPGDLTKDDIADDVGWSVFNCTFSTKRLSCHRRVGPRTVRSA